MTGSSDLAKVNTDGFAIQLGIPELLSPIDWVDLYQLPSALGICTHRSSVPSERGSQKRLSIIYLAIGPSTGSIENRVDTD